MVFRSFSKGQSVPEFMIVLIAALLLFSSAFFMITNQGSVDEESLSASQLKLVGHSLSARLQSQAYLPVGSSATSVIPVSFKMQLLIQQNRLTLTTAKGGYYSERMNVPVLGVLINDWNGYLRLTTTNLGVQIHD